ncbi:MAG TPA: DNA repair protein RadC [Nitrospiraceae bacterium]|nr:DNA repair protein RadC [Nitrospiraceae bacterium]
MEDRRRGAGIVDWPKAERPRERLLTHGAEALSDAHLLAILLRVGRQDASAVEVAMDILREMRGVAGLVHCGLQELCAIPGVGIAKAAQLKAALELGRRAMAAPLSTGVRVSSSADLFKHFHPRVRNLRHEIFTIVLLDAKNAIIREATVSEGTLTHSLVHPREVFQLAIRESAAAVILLHNHPSGDPTPSQEDRLLTSRLIAAGHVLGIRVLDHLVVGDGRYVSFADQGWIEPAGSNAEAIGNVGLAFPKDASRSSARREHEAR